MEGQKDPATLQYEREIRIGMLLLGLLAVVFVGVMARRIWVENGQQLAATKKPIYLTKAQRDERLSKNKPRSLNSLQAATPMRRIRSSANTPQANPGEAEPDLTSIPELVIGESEPEETQTRPANHVEAESSTEEAQKSPSPIPIRPRATPLDESSPKDPGRAEAAPGDEAASPTAAAVEDEATLRDGAATENSQVDKGSRFRDDNTKEDEGNSKPASSPPLESPELASPPPSTARPLLNSASKIDDSPSPTVAGERAEVVRKKVAKNPWKRTDAPPTAVDQARYTAQSGDTLKSIAKEILGDETRWQEIYDLNRSEIGDDFANLRKGIKLKLPKLSEEPPAAADPKSEGAKIDLPSVLKK